MTVLEGGEGVEGSLREAARDATLGIAEAAAGSARFDAGAGEAGLCFKQDGAAQRVEAVDRAGVEDRETRNRRLRDQVELDGVAEGLVEARAVEIDGEALRLALERGSDEAAIDEIGLPGIVLRVLKRDARDGAGERTEQVGRAGAGYADESVSASSMSTAPPGAVTMIAPPSSSAWAGAIAATPASSDAIKTRTCTHILPVRLWWRSGS